MPSQFSSKENYSKLEGIQSSWKLFFCVCKFIWQCQPLCQSLFQLSLGIHRCTLHSNPKRQTLDMQLLIMIDHIGILWHNSVIIFAISSGILHDISMHIFVIFVYAYEMVGLLVELAFDIEPEHCHLALKLHLVTKY